MKSKDMAMTAIEAAFDKKALEPALLDVRKHSSYTDYVLVLSGRSDRHVQSVADGVVAGMKAEGLPPIGVEGARDGKWILIDFGAVVVHVFYHPVRDFYDLEGLWVDAPRIKLDIPAESRLHVSDVYTL